MEDEKFVMFRNRLVKVLRHLSRQARRLGVTCYRLYDHDLPEFPFCIELYEGNLYVAEYKRRHGLSGEEHERWLRHGVDVMQEVFGLPRENIFLKERKVKEGRSSQYKAAAGPRKQENTDDMLFANEFVVHENRLKFIVNLSDYLDTGLFLDHRITREIVRSESLGKRVLNLFCYTGAFSVYAAAGGADEVISVDLSKTYLDRAGRNMRLNGFTDEAKYEYIHADVMEYLKTIKENRFDLVILDPPTFSNSQRMAGFLDIQRDHVRLIDHCLRALATGGVLYFSTNAKKFLLNDKAIGCSSIKDITTATTPFDFKGRFSRYCFRITK